METFIPEVRITSEIDSKETKGPIVSLNDLNIDLKVNEEDEESDWIWFGVGGPA